MPADAVTDTTVIAAVDKAYTNPVYEGTKAEAYLSPSKRKPLHISDSSLYRVTSDPTARYLVETDPAYADRKTFLSSDYFFRRMQYDPEKLENVWATATMKANSSATGSCSSKENRQEKPNTKPSWTPL